MAGLLEGAAQGEDSPGKFRMLALASLVKRQLGVTYHLPFSEGEYDGRDSRNLFLHGVLSGRGGTCVTPPVLYIAIGRRFGYPLFLVKTRDHYFARWDEQGVERFNVECTSPGFASHSDRFYQTWKTPVSDAEVRSGAFLRNLSRREEAANFLNERGNCLLDRLQLGRALEAYYYAHRIVPHDGCIRGNWIVATIMHREIEQAMRDADRRGTDAISIDEMQYPDPGDANEAWAIPFARRTFTRILTIHQKPPPTSQPAWQRKPRRGEPNYKTH